jgi:ketosteroid isomerase-like protein
MRADSAMEREVFAALDEFFENLANRRLEETLAAFAPDADVALYGSEVSEIVIGPDALRSFFGRLYEKLGGPRFTFRQRRLSSSGSVAWFVADAEVALGAHVASPYRLSGVLEKRDGRWLWLLFNGSEPQADRA